MLTNWKTTVAGIFTAVMVVVAGFIQNGVTDWKTALMAMGVAAIGALSKDSSTEGK